MTDLFFLFQDYEGITVEYRTLPGWEAPITGCKSFEELPPNAQNYVKTIEELLQIPSKLEEYFFASYLEKEFPTRKSFLFCAYYFVSVRWVGVGQARSAMIERKI